MTTVLCYGDSNTYGFDPRGFWDDRYGEDVRWCDLLAQKTGWQVINLGLNGRTIPKSPRELDVLDHAIQKAAPDLSMILLGTNDILQGHPPEMAAQEMDELIGHCKSRFPELPLLLLSPPFTRLWDTALSRKIAALGSLYRQISQARNIPFLLLPELPLAFDGVHFSEAGHRQLAEFLCSYLCTYFSQGDFMP